MKPPYQNAQFLKSITHIRQAPFSLAEVAFSGRSNCGKSSLINVLTNQKKIAKVSKLPGRTREINFFTLGDDKYLVDLPGYGYAKVAQQMRANWQDLIESYLNHRKELKMLFILMDSRHPLTTLDQVQIDFCVKKQIEFSILATKSDQINQSAKHKTIGLIKDFLIRKYKLELESIWLTSAFKKTGFDPVLDKLDQVLRVN